MIVKDEAFFIEECLAHAAPHVDEIVVVDTGSTDGTRGIVERFAHRVVDFAWIDDFSAARNAGLELASGDWILVLDADERLDEAGFGALREAMGSAEIDGYYLEQRGYSDSQLASGWTALPEAEAERVGFRGYAVNPIMRLFRNRPGIRYAGRIHEIVDGSIEASRRGTLDLPLHHYAESNPERPRHERNLRYLAMMDEELAQQPDGRLFGIAGSTAMYHAGDYDKAQRYLRRAAELGYEPQRSLEGAAEAAYRGGNHGVAADLYRNLYDGGYRTPALCLNRANLAVRAGNSGEAVALLRECLALGGLGPEVSAVIEQNLRHLEAGA
jgi:glycosyltransferase involved in cell wall biosynthesis